MDVCNSIIDKASDNSNDKYIPCKPTIAKLYFDDELQSALVQHDINSSKDNIPIQCTYDIESTMDFRELDEVYGNSELNSDMHGEIVTGEEMEQQDFVNDPIINMVQTTQTNATTSWHPNLNTIVEEMVYDLQQHYGKCEIMDMHISSGKKKRSRQHKLQSQRQEYESKIANAIPKNGLYRVQILSAQHDSGANRSVTACKDILLYYTDIEDYAINGVKDGEPAIVCTGKGYVPWRAKSGEIILIRCLYCPKASGTIISPSNVNSQYSNRYSGWVMDTNFDSKMGSATTN
jgi:hypothetical protein